MYDIWVVALSDMQSRTNLEKNYILEGGKIKIKAKVISRKISSNVWEGFVNGSVHKGMESNVLPTRP